MGKIAKERMIATDLKVYACSYIDLGEILFHYVMFGDKESTHLSNKIYRNSFR